jgi:hypothetical protein
MLLSPGVIAPSQMSGLSLRVPAIKRLNISDDPFIPSIITTNPILPAVHVPRRYQDLNADQELRQRMTSYYYSKLFDQWVYSDFYFMLKNLVVKGNKISVTRKNFDKNPTESDIQRKIDFLKHRVFTREVVYRLLIQYTNRSRSNWYDLKINKQHVKALLRHKLAKAIRQLL